MPGSFMTGYAGFGIADEQQGEFMGKPPWMRQTRDSARMGLPVAELFCFLK